MLKAIGLDWRTNLAQECWFYFRTCRNWREVIAGRLHNVPFRQFTLRAGMVIGFPGNPPWQIFQEIWRYHCYTPRVVMPQTTPKLVVDVGANIGFFALYAARRWPGATVFAYEPAPENFYYLKRNIDQSRADRVICRRIAVTDLVGETPFFLKKESGWHSVWGSEAEAAISVPSVDFAALCKEVGEQPIDLLKVDCEGAEYKILEGREDLLGRRVHAITMEYHEFGGHQVKELEEILTRAGYAVEIRPEPRWHTGMLFAKLRAQAV